MVDLLTPKQALEVTNSVLSGTEMAGQNDEDEQYCFAVAL